MARNKNKSGKKGGLLKAIGKGIRWLLLRLLPVAVLAGIVGYSGAKIYANLKTDPWLKVQEIRVSPSDALSQESVRKLEELLIDKNILIVDLKKIERSIELGPGARSVRVVREMPSTLRVEIEKRRPIANVQFKSGGDYAIVATDGFIIDVRQELDPAWILIEDYSEKIKAPKVGLRVENKGFQEAIKFVDIFRRHELSRRERVTRISLDPYGNVTARLGEGPDFQMGRKPSEQLSFLTKAVYLFKTEPRENIEYMDIQHGRVAVKRKQ